MSPFVNHPPKRRCNLDARLDALQFVGVGFGAEKIGGRMQTASRPRCRLRCQGRLGVYRTLSARFVGKGRRWWLGCQWKSGRLSKATPKRLLTVMGAGIMSRDTLDIHHRAYRRLPLVVLCFVPLMPLCCLSDDLPKRLCSRQPTLCSQF